MRIALLARNSKSIEIGEKLLAHGHQIPIVATCEASDFHTVSRSDFEEFANRINAKFIFGSDLTKENSYRALKASQCDLAVSRAWLTVLPKPVIDLFPLGILNSHAGDLPKYRGNACPAWAILNKEKRFTVTVHKMTPELDAGPVLLKQHKSIENDTYITDFATWRDSIICEMFATVVSELEKNEIVAVPQSLDPMDAFRCYPRRPTDGEIDWNGCVDDIYRLIRASSKPYLGAFSFLEGAKKITIWRAKPFVSPNPYCAIPGQICLRSKRGNSVVACRDGMIELTDIDDDARSGHKVVQNLILKSLRNRLMGSN